MGKHLDFDWVDAFTDRPFGGNGCAVVHDAGHVDAETCMAFTRETGLVECTFVEPSDRADVKVRYFMANKEIPFAGHPTVATVAALVDRGLVGDKVTLDTGAGVIPVEVSGGAVPVVTMTQVAPRFGAEIAPEIVARVGGLDAEDIIATPQVVSTGLPFCITLLRSKDALRRAKMNVDALAQFRDGCADVDAGLMEPFWVTLGGATDAGDTFSRLLLAPPMPPEDAFTGSATGAMASYLWAKGQIAASRFVAQQGHDMGRPGQADVEVLGPPERITGVRVGGPGYVLMRGKVSL